MPKFGNQSFPNLGIIIKLYDFKLSFLLKILVFMSNLIDSIIHRKPTIVQSLKLVTKYQEYLL